MRKCEKQVAIGAKTKKPTGRSTKSNNTINTTTETRVLPVFGTCVLLKCAHFPFSRLLTEQ